MSERRLPEQRPPLGRRGTPRTAPRRRDGGRVSWVRAGSILVSAFLVWLVMDAVVLQHSADHDAPLGARRTAALDVLDPLSDLSRWTGLDLPASGGNVALGRQSDGGFSIPTVPTTTSTTQPKGVPTTTTTFPQPTVKHPVRILLVGDSIGEDLDAPLLNALVATGVAVVNTDGMISTGLTRLDYFNWILELEDDVYKYHPDIVIGMMGANDSQSFVDPPILFGTPAWRAKYLRNVGQFFSIGRAGGRQMFWVSIPIIANTGLSHEWQLTRNLQHQAAVAHRVFYIDSDLTLDPGGTYHQFLKVGGQITQVRIPDGIHLEPAGATLLAAAVLVDVERDLHVHL
jgi:lysophospholipase L1-like esterase